MVRLVAARARLVRLRFVRPVRTARGVFAERESVLLELRDADGVPGFGEAAPWPGFVTESADQANALLTAAEPLLCGPELVAGIWTRALDAHLCAAPAARAAVQGALWDLAARRARRPLAELLRAGVCREHDAFLGRVPVSALLLAREPAALREEAARARAAGHRAAKIKLGSTDLGADVARARAAREGLGAGVALRGDANGAWNEPRAREALAALAEFGFEYIEQPVAADDVAGLASLRGHANVQIAADESVATEDGVARLLEARAADVLVLKPAMLGGPARAIEIATRARQAGCRVVFSHAFESLVGAMHVLHCAAAWGDRDAVHALATAGLFESDVAQPIECHAGMLEVPLDPGLGITP
jgi:o-succinylbenzoate synthase